MRLTLSLLHWGKVSWLCCVGVVSSPTGSITLVSFLRENLLLHSSYLPLGISQGTCDLHVSRRCVYHVIDCTESKPSPSSSSRHVSPTYVCHRRHRLLTIGCGTNTAKAVPKMPTYVFHFLPFFFQENVRNTYTC